MQLNVQTYNLQNAKIVDILVSQKHDVFVMDVVFDQWVMGYGVTIVKVFLPLLAVFWLSNTFSFFSKQLQLVSNYWT